MKSPLQITARNMELTEAIRAEITDKAEKLNNYFDRIMRCRVVVEAPHRHRNKGKLYNVRIDMTVPGAELVIRREPNEDLYVAVRDSFDAARRKLEDFARKRRGDVKGHEEAPQARVSAVFSDRGYGFLTAPDGREIYFHEHSILNTSFSQVKVGMKVRYVEEEGEKGAQASTVTIIG